MIRQRIPSRATIAKALLDDDFPHGQSRDAMGRYMMLYVIADGKSVRIVDDAAQGGPVVEIDE